MSASEDLAPPLLAQGDDLSQALRAGNQEFSALVDEGAAFQRLSVRLSAPRGFKPPLARVALPAFALLAVLALVMFNRREPVTIVAERVGGGKNATTSLRSVVNDASPEPSPTPEPSALPVSQQARKRSVAARASALLERATPQPNAAARAPEASEVARATADQRSDASAEPDCLSLARTGATHEAEACFVERSRGSGLGAEMALYELGRLRRDVLGDSRGALAALEQHAARFPSGSLRREVEMSALGLLVQLGRSREALERSSALLESQSGGERRAELHLFRGQVFRRNLSDFRAAELEYAKAEALAGSTAAEATYLRGLCQEALGEPLAAIESYRRYLAKPSRPRAADVQRRLTRLSSP
ncbi:MAG TPA: tetratricopeptide repeat protein [Polyangiaceae bacterium]|nr:tetratricopeptide repeat protein [Polyangiaceae bacterium]